jgi:2-keto-4-pentenoate hydratase/2-oxohepta-3-ene-1,7-dioic acid hydratase in catechol pathway
VPQFFTKATHAVNAPDGDVRLDPRVTRRFDYEVELAVIIGASGRDIPKERAIDHVYGYAVANDFTARDLQRRHQQWFKGKSLDTTFPFGPWIVDREEIGDPSNLELSLTVNGEERQRVTVDRMIFDIPTLIASLSAGLTLEAGDIISTGTPAGVGFAMDPPRYLKGGGRRRLDDRPHRVAAQSHRRGMRSRLEAVPTKEKGVRADALTPSCAGSPKVIGLELLRACTDRPSRRRRRRRARSHRRSRPRHRR